MSVSSLRRLLYALLLLRASVINAQSGAIEWIVPTYVGASDQRAILEIARSVGIADPHSVWKPAIYSDCGLLHLESTPVLGGNRVQSSVLAIRQVRRTGCVPVAAGQRTAQRGNWVAVLGPSNPQHRERWRIRDGSWQVDIRLGDGVPYEDALAIVLAIRHRQVVDRRPATPGGFQISAVDPSQIIYIGFSPDRPPITAQYEVSTTILEGLGGGYRLIVTVEDGTVALHQQYFDMP